MKGLIHDLRSSLRAFDFLGSHLLSTVCFCRDFDFDSNDRWNAYKGNLEIPAGKSVEQTLNKVKAKWYKREIVSPCCLAQ